MKDIKTKMVKRAEKLNQIFQERNCSFQIIYESEIIINRGRRDAYSFRSEIYNVTPIMYFNEEWWVFSDEELADYMEKIFAEHAKKVNAREYLSREYILSHVRPVLLSADNIPILEEKDIVYMHYLDMVLSFELILEEDEEGTAAIKIKRWNLKNTIKEISMEELLLAAQRYILKNYEIQEIDDVLEEGGYDKEDYADKPPIYVVTTKNHVKGAAAILSPEVLDQLTEKLGTETILFLPASIHEMMAVAAEDLDIDHAKNMVRVANRTIVEPENRLTDSVYILENGMITNV